jgi:ribose transport system ATP-binding protein
MNELSVANKQLVIIAKALSQNASLIIFDEPTTMLSEKEVENLFKIIKKLKKKGIGVIYITHRMDEIYTIGDRISILKDGANVSTHLIGDITINEICNKMVGRELSMVFPPKAKPSLENVLNLEKISTEKIEDITFSLKKGEVLGIAGLVGSGRTEILNAIFGVDKILEGRIEVNGKPIKRKHIKESLKEGLAYIPEDRKNKGIIGKHSVLDNFSLLNSMLNNKFGFYNLKKGIELCTDYMEQLSVKTPNIDEIIGNLSGGNQQKVVLAKWLSISPQIILLDEPTQGIDVGSKAEIYNIIHSLTSKGISIILVSSELIEIINLSNRVIVMKNGRICKTLEGEEITEEKIISYAMGVGD